MFFPKTINNIDSLTQLIREADNDTMNARYYLELSDLTMYNDQKRAFQYLEIADSLYINSNNYKGLANLYAQKANYYYRLGEIIPVFIKYHDSLHLGNVYLMKVKIAMANGYYNIAIEETYKALTQLEIFFM